MRRIAIVVLWALPLGAVLGLAGCAQSPGSPGGAVGVSSGSAPASAASANPQDMALRFAQCMRDHGVPMDDPDANGQGMRVGGPGVDQQKIQAAQEACRQFAPFGAGSGQQPDPALRERVLKFAQCMRDNGVPNFPDPQAGMAQLDTSVTGDPDFPRAQRLCEQKYLSDVPGTW